MPLDIATSGPPSGAIAGTAETEARAAVGLPPNTRVVVAMSGGVDSTVTAALLKGAGYDVVGVTLQLYDHGAILHKKGACCAGQDIHDARSAAERMGVPHYVLDYEGRFREAVIEEFADSYLRGETPIPCIRCNQTVKFRDLLEIARELGAEALATGHYVQRIEGPRGPELHRAADPARDQSYFLFATTREQLEFLRFPLGGLPKPEVRRAANELGLAVADKREVIVGPREALLTRALTLKETNWLGDQPTLDDAAREGLEVLARVRSTREPLPARLAMENDVACVVFDGAEEGVSPGQACVLYDPASAGSRVLGGGFIAGTVAAAT